MKFLIVLSVAVAYAAAAALDESAAPIVKSTYDISPEGAYNWAYETGNGIYAQEQGTLVQGRSEYPFIEAKGAFRYTSPEGVPIELTYAANEGGFQPQGAHLPVPPPIPEAIVRSLQYIEAHPPPIRP